MAVDLTVHAGRMLILAAGFNPRDNDQDWFGDVVSFPMGVLSGQVGNNPTWCHAPGETMRVQGNPSNNVTTAMLVDEAGDFWFQRPVPGTIVGDREVDALVAYLNTL